MSTITCPKCGKSQPSGKPECIHCGVIFNKLSRTSSPPHADPEPPEASQAQQSFLPPVGLSMHLEITILNIFAYIYLIIGIGSGIGIIVTGEGELKSFIGLSIIVGALVTSMLFFVFCTIAKKLVSIDTTLNEVLKIFQAKYKPQ